MQGDGIAVTREIERRAERLQRTAERPLQLRAPNVTAWHKARIGPRFRPPNPALAATIPSPRFRSVYRPPNSAARKRSCSVLSPATGSAHQIPSGRRAAAHGPVHPPAEQDLPILRQQTVTGPDRAKVGLGEQSARLDVLDDVQGPPEDA